MAQILGMLGGGAATEAAAGAVGGAAGGGGLLGGLGDMAGAVGQTAQGIGGLDIMKTLEGLDSLVAARDGLPGQLRGGLLGGLGQPQESPAAQQHREGLQNTSAMQFNSALQKAIDMRRRRRPIGTLGQ